MLLSSGFDFAFGSRSLPTRCKRRGAARLSGMKQLSAFWLASGLLCAACSGGTNVADPPVESLSDLGFDATERAVPEIRYYVVADT